MAVRRALSPIEGEIPTEASYMDYVSGMGSVPNGNPAPGTINAMGNTTLPQYYMGYPVGAKLEHTPPDPYKEAVSKIKPRVTRVEAFVQLGTIWSSTIHGSEFVSWQRSHPDILITGTNFLIYQNQLHMIVTYSEEI